MVPSANVSAWQNQLQMPFACNSTGCKWCWHLGLAGIPVTQESPEISCPTEAQDAVWGAGKKVYASHRVWMGPCGGSDRYLVLVVPLKGSRSYPGSAALYPLPDPRHRRGKGGGFSLCHHHALSRGSGMRTRERTTLGACSFIPSATQENRRWSLGQNTLQLFPFMLREDNHYTEKGWIGSLLL